MDDRFDRRELLIDLGEVLRAVHCLARTSQPEKSVGRLAREVESLQDFEFIRH
jgi:hypothetical protein